MLVRLTTEQPLAGLVLLDWGQKELEEKYEVARKY
jgi:hypothetical protein